MLEEWAASFWFRSLLPLTVGLVYELATRYVRKRDTQPFDQEDWFFAIPLLGAAVTALPPLIALRTRSGAEGGEAVTLGALVLVFLVMVAFIVVTFDRRFLGPRRRGNIHWQRMLATWLPNAFAAAVAVAALAIVAP